MIKAFTLLEVIVSILIFAIAVTSMLDSMGQGAVLTYESKDLLQAVHLAELKMHDIERDIAKNGISEDEEENEGEFDDEEFEKFHWIDRRKKIEIPDDIAVLSKMLGADVESETEDTRQAGFLTAFLPFIQQILEVFETSVREIEVEVYWFDEEDEDERYSYILTTHYIDFSKLDQMPNLNTILGGRGSIGGKTSSTKESKK